MDLALRDAVQDIAARHNLPIVFDARSLEDAGDRQQYAGYHEPERNNASMARCELLLRDLDLSYVIRDEVLMITTRDVAKSQLSTRFYSASETIPTREDIGINHDPANG